MQTYEMEPKRNKDRKRVGSGISAHLLDSTMSPNCTELFRHLNRANTLSRDDVTQGCENKDSALP